MMDLEDVPDPQHTVSELDKVYDSLKSEIGRQNQLHSSYQNSIMQRIGIIIAFASILLLDAFDTFAKLQTDSIGFIICVMAMGFLISSCCLGVIFMLDWKKWTWTTGADVESLIERYNADDLEGCEYLIFDGLVVSNDNLEEMSDVLKRRLVYTVSVFLIGLIAMCMTKVTLWF